MKVFAEYFSTIKINEREADVGMISDNHLALLRRNTCRMTTSCSPTWMSTRDLFRVQRNSSVYHETTEHRSMFYAESWLVVHYIYDKRWIDRAFAYFNLVSGGVPVEDAIQQGFGISSMTFDAELHDYVKEGRFLYAKMSPPAGVDSAGYTVKSLEGPQARALLADAHLHSRDYQEKAFAEFEEVLKVQPDNVVALRGLGCFYMTKQDPQRASEYLKQALERRPDDPRALYYSALLTEAREKTNPGKNPEQLAGAEKQLEKAIMLDPEFADAYASLGHLYALQGNSEPATRAMLKAAELNPRNENYALDLAQLYVSRGRYDDAIQVLQTRARSSDTGVASRASAMLALASAHKHPSSGQAPAQGTTQPPPNSPSEPSSTNP